MARLTQVDRKAMVTQITALYKSGEQKSISDCTSQTLRMMGYKNRKPHHVPLLSALKIGQPGLMKKVISHYNDLTFFFPLVFL